MTRTHAGSVAVLVAHRFNLTAANQYWLVKEGIVDEGDFAEGTIFTDNLVQARTSQFHMLILPDQLQFVPLVEDDKEQDVVTGKLGKLVGLLPHIPYRALGMNYTWHLTPEDGDTNRVTRGLFYVPDRPLFKAFADENARFGGYLSKDFGSFRMKLNVMPIVTTEENSTTHRIQLSFNFHTDLGKNAAADVQERLAHWNELRAESARIVDEVQGGM